MGWNWFQKSWAKCEELLGSCWRLTQVAVLIGVVFPLLLFAWKWHRPPQSASHAAVQRKVLPFRHTSPDIHLTGTGLGGRHLLPYSVIPGGALSAEELKSALMNDPVAAGHYAGFDAATAHVVRLDRDRAVYVSYRLGNHVYWTSKRLTLLRGETVLTDGEHEARTRCGNRISDTPQLPVALKEPEQAVLENPHMPILPEGIPEWSFPLGDLVFPSLPLEAVEPPGGGFFVPPFLPIGGGGGTPGSTTVPTTPTSPISPPAATPEPASLLLLSSGFLGLWLRRKSRSS
jgi:PEP-CTERM motif